MQITENWNQNERPHITANEILRGMEHTREAHERCIISAGPKLAQIQEWRKCLKERKIRLYMELDSTIEAIEQLNEAMTRMLEHTAYCNGYENAEADLTPKARIRKIAKK